MSLPVGIIILWYKNLAEIPAGWAVCDGTSGTPDLRGKYVVGASSDGEVGGEFGSAVHTHTNPSVSAADDHRHTYSPSDLTVIGNEVSKVDVTVLSTGYEGASKTHAHTVPVNSAYSGTHNHSVGNTVEGAVQPPFLQLYFIMKVA